MTSRPSAPPDEDQPIPFPVGYVMWRGLTVLSHSFVPFVIISAAAIALPFFYRWGDGTPAAFVATMAMVLLHSVFRSVCDAMIVCATVQALSGRRVRPGISVVRGLRRIGPVLLTATLVGVSVLMGFFLLLVPGLIALVVMFLAIPACVMERLGPVRSIQRSSALTRGCRWQIFAVYCAIVTVSITVNLLIGALTRGAPSWVLPSVGFGWIALVNAYEAVVMAVIYHDLRVIKDGMDPHGIAAVFD